MLLYVSFDGKYSLQRVLRIGMFVFKDPQVSILRSTKRDCSVLSDQRPYRQILTDSSIHGVWRMIKRISMLEKLSPHPPRTTT